jgi:hypothetical protein
MKPDYVKEIEKKPVKYRTEKEHFTLMGYYGGIRNYLLSMGDFKDVPMEDEQGGGEK